MNRNDTPKRGFDSGRPAAEGPLVFRAQRLIRLLTEGTETPPIAFVLLSHDGRVLDLQGDRRGFEILWKAGVHKGASLAECTGEAAEPADGETAPSGEWVFPKLKDCSAAYSPFAFYKEDAICPLGGIAVIASRNEPLALLQPLAACIAHDLTLNLHFSHEYGALAGRQRRGFWFWTIWSMPGR